MMLTEPQFRWPTLALEAWAGRWYIVQTSLPFWQQRSHPCVNYTLENHQGQPRLLDEVSYLNASGQPRRVLGYDYLVQHPAGQFLWLAKPWYLFFLRSRWGVLAHDPDCSEWAVTCFSKTLFTPAGLDIYSRSPQLNPEALLQIDAQLESHPLFAQERPGLFATQQ